MGAFGVVPPCAHLLRFFLKYYHVPFFFSSTKNVSLPQEKRKEKTLSHYEAHTHTSSEFVLRPTRRRGCRRFMVNRKRESHGKKKGKFVRKKTNELGSYRTRKEKNGS